MQIQKPYLAKEEYNVVCSAERMKKKATPPQSTPSRGLGVDLNNCLLFAQFNYSEKIYIHITKQQLC